MQFPGSRLLIFAKAPIVGQVKTRLIPALGEEQACALYQACLDYTLGQRCMAAIAPVTLCVWPDIGHPAFIQYAKTYPLTLEQQTGQDLGERMDNACRQALLDADVIVLTGTDAPALSNGTIVQAFNALAQGVDVVMAPAEDGGYVLLGLRRYMAELFTDIPWGSPQVAQLTRQRCQDKQLTLHELTLCWDIDRPEDVVRLSRHFPQLWPLGGQKSHTSFIEKA